MKRNVAFLLLLMVLLAPLPLAGQEELVWDPEMLQLRAELEELMLRYEAVARSEAYSGQLRALGQSEAARIRARLEEGDFLVGDRIFLSVAGEAELSDTFAVAGGTVLELPAIGEVSLDGVLRSELETHLTGEIERFIRDPIVDARPLIRIWIRGEVSEPGFYLMAAEVPIPDAIMQVGGPTENANVDAMRVDREGETIWSGPPLIRAVSSGRTLDQLNLRTGDQVVIPGGQGFDLGSFGTTALFAIPTLIIAITQAVN